MSRRRASNTVALLHGAGLAPGTHTTEVRKIENGHIVRKSSYDEKTGAYSSSERFVGRGEGGRQSGTLRDAVATLEGR